jgi:uncharacterized protein (TIGR00369 family)
MASQRSGKIWDMLRGTVPMAPAARTLGWRVLEMDPDAGTISIEFQASERFLNPAGAIQGGFLAAMLDDTLGPALAITLSPDEFAPTLDLHVQYLRPARPERLVGHGRVVQRGREVCFMAGELVNEAGKTVAVATATARISTFAAVDNKEPAQATARSGPTEG